MEATCCTYDWFHRFTCGYEWVGLVGRDWIEHHIVWIVDVVHSGRFFGINCRSDCNIRQSRPVDLILALGCSSTVHCNRSSFAIAPAFRPHHTGNVNNLVGHRCVNAAKGMANRWIPQSRPCLDCCKRAHLPRHDCTRRTCIVARNSNITRYYHVSNPVKRQVACISISDWIEGSEQKVLNRTH